MIVLRVTGFTGEESVVLPTHEHIADHRGHAIWRRKPGFEFTPVLLGKIASFLVRPPDGGVAVFAFMYSLLDTLDGTPPDEADLLDAALQTIEDAIDAGPLADRHEATYEYRSGEWVPVRDPRWWVSVLR